MSAPGNTDPRAGLYHGPIPDARCTDCDRVLDDVEVPRCKDCRECGDVHRPPGWVCTEPAEHKRIVEWCDALSTTVIRLTEEKEHDLATIGALDSALRHLNAWCPSHPPREAEIERLLATPPLPTRSLLQLRARLWHGEYDVTDCPICPMVASDRDEALHGAQLMHLEQQRWQGMAEDLWEELQLWHRDTCPHNEAYHLKEPGECLCHRILAKAWDELTHADDYVDEAAPVPGEPS